MGKLTMVLMLLAAIVTTMPVSTHGITGKDTLEVKNWFKMISHEKQKLTKLHFYFHAIPKGNSPNQARVAEANTTSSSPSLFGMLNVVDYPLTDRPELSSKVVGRAQGFYVSVSMKVYTFLMSFNLIFPDGSSISFSGHNPTTQTSREMPVTGGSGTFRLAQGVVTFKTYSYDVASGNATIEVNVLAMHY